MAVLASLIYSANRGEKDKALGPEDFMWPKPVDPDIAEQAERDAARSAVFWESALSYFRNF